MNNGRLPIRNRLANPAAVLAIALVVASTLTAPDAFAATSSVSAKSTRVAAVKSPSIHNRSYAKIPNEVLYRVDATGKPVISGDLSNVLQGDAGDCYFLSSLSALAYRSPASIQKLIHNNGNGTYTATFHGLLSGKKGTFTATVNGDLPGTSSKQINNSVEKINGKSVAWAAISEKLWAAVNGNSYDGIDGTDDPNPANDHDIHNALFALTGKEPVERKVSSLTLSQIQKDLAAGVVVIGTSTDADVLTADHAMAVLKVDTTRQTVTLKDPEESRLETVTFKQLTSPDVNQYFTVALTTASRQSN